MKKDPNQAAKSVVDQIIESSETIKAKYGRVLYERQRAGGRKGGVSRWEKMTPEERTAHIRKMNTSRKTVK